LELLQKSRGVTFSRKPTVNVSEVIALKQQGMRAIDISKEMGIGRSTVYKVLKG